MPNTKIFKPKGSRFWKLLVEKDGKHKIAFKAESKLLVKQKRAMVQANVVDHVALTNKRTFKELYKEFSEYKLEEANNEHLGGKVHSMKTYMCYWNKWINPYFPEHILVSGINVQVAIDYFKKIMDNGSTWMTADRVVKSFLTALKYARRKQYISKLGDMEWFKPKKETSLKAKDPSQMECKETPMITFREAKLLLEKLCPNQESSIEEWRNFTIASTFVFCGLRMSELRALRWHNIDFDLQKLSIKNSIVGTILGKGKTKAAQRTITIHPLLLRVLKQWKRVHYSYWKETTSWVYPGIGKYSDLPVPVWERSIRDFLNLAFVDLGLAKIKLVSEKGRPSRKRIVILWSKFGNNPTRTFRHFSSTSLVEAQAANPDILHDNFIRNYQGHESIETTRNIYARHLNRDATPERVASEAKALANAIPIELPLIK